MEMTSQVSLGVLGHPMLGERGRWGVSGGLARLVVSAPGFAFADGWGTLVPQSSSCRLRGFCLPSSIFQEREQRLWLGCFIGAHWRFWTACLLNSKVIGLEFEQTLRDSGGQGSLPCCSPRSHRVGHG